MLARGRSAVTADSRLVYASISPRGSAARITCFVGKGAVESGVTADAIVRAAAKVLGGAGGGTKEFAQGGGPKADRMKEAADAVYDKVSELVRS